MVMHFEDSKIAMKYCFSHIQAWGFDAFAAAHWKYDPDAKMGQLTLLQPFFEQQEVVTVQASAADFQDMKDSYFNRFSSQFPKRIGNFHKPSQHILTEYDDWGEFYSVWMVRAGQNITQQSIPLLFDIKPADKPNHCHVFATFYAEPSKEFYRFAIAEQSDKQIRDIESQTTAIIKEAYGT